MSGSPGKSGLYALGVAALCVQGVGLRVRALGDGARPSVAALQVFLLDTAWIALPLGLLVGVGCAARRGSLGDTLPSRRPRAPVTDLVSGLGLGALWLLLGLPLPGLIAVHGHVAVSALVAGYLGLLGVFAVVLALGYGMGCFLRSALSATLLAGSLTAVLVAAWSWAEGLASPWQEPVRYLSLLQKHFYPAMRGVLRLSDFVYFASFAYGVSWLSWLGSQRSRPGMPRATARVAALGVGLGLLAANYLAVRWDVRRDVASSFRTGPSEETVNWVQRLPQLPQVWLFARPESPQATAGLAYAEALTAALSWDGVHFCDAARCPDRVRRYRVPGNGYLVLVHGEASLADNEFLGTDAQAVRPADDAGAVTADVIFLGQDSVAVARRMRALDGEVQAATARRLGQDPPLSSLAQVAVTHVPASEGAWFWLGCLAPASLVLAVWWLVQRHDHAQCDPGRVMSGSTEAGGPRFAWAGFSFHGLLVMLAGVMVAKSVSSTAATLEGESPTELISCAEVSQLSAVLILPEGEYRLSSIQEGFARRRVTIRRTGHAQADGAAEPPIESDEGSKAAMDAHPDLMKMVLSLPEYEQFTANQAAERWASDVAHLPIARVLADIPQERLSAFGLSVGSTARLQITCGEREWHLSVGDEVYGTAERYVRRASGGPVLIVPNAPFAEMHSARFRLMFNRVAFLPPGQQVSAVRWQVGGQASEVTRAADGTWRTADGTTLSGFGPWLQRVASLPVLSYLPLGEQPLGMAVHPQAALNLTLSSSNGMLSNISLYASLRKNGLRYFARSDDTGAWVALYRSAAQAAWSAMASWREALPQSEPMPGSH